MFTKKGILWLECQHHYYGCEDCNENRILYIEFFGNELFTTKKENPEMMGLKIFSK